MLPKFTSKMVLCLSIIVASFAAGSLPAATAGASTLASELLPVSQRAVACLTTDLCVVAGRDARHGTGDVIVVSGGKSGKAADVRGSQSLFAVSCPIGGCIALGQPSLPGKLLFVETNENGKVLGSGPSRIPSGVSFTSVSCLGLANCRVFGTYGTGSSSVPELGIWNGASVLGSRLALPPGMSHFAAADVSCYVSVCEAVGTALKNGGRVGLVLEVRGLSVLETSVQVGGAMTGVSCVTVTLCYAVGDGRTASFADTIRSGVITLVSPVTSAHLTGISCEGASCLAVGSRRQVGATYGTLTDISSGKVMSTTLVHLSGGFTSVSGPSAGSGFAALGLAHGTGSEITTTN